jgi:hypothetical protein
MQVGDPGLEPTSIDKDNNMATTSLTRLKIRDLYFYAAMALAAISRHRQLLHPLLVPVQGHDWYTQLEANVSGYREAVDLLLRDRLETGLVFISSRELIGRITLWRRCMEAVARRAPQSQQDNLLRAIGRGQGSPRSIRACKAFLHNVKSSVAVNAEQLAALGACTKDLDFAQHTLAQLEQDSERAALERAEDGQARYEMQTKREQLVRQLDDLNLAVEVAASQAELYGDSVGHAQTSAIKAELKSALEEACVRARG